MKGAFFFILLLSQPLLAHGFARSVSTWRVGDEAVAVRLSAPLIAAESIALNNPRLTAAERFQHHLSQTIALSKGTTTCAQVKNKAKVAGSKIFAELRFQCPPGNDLKIELHSFFDSDPSHIHFARFLFGEKGSEYIFSNQTRQHLINIQHARSSKQASSSSEVFGSYLVLGVRHILAGLDHLAFLLALLLVCGVGRALLWAITGFTLGHSLTLGLAASGWLVANIPMVEALIGWTILLMALERSGLVNNNFRTLMLASAAGLLLCLVASFFVPTQLTALAFLGLIIFSVCWGFYIQNETHAKKLVPILSVGFGLIHGLGFAAVLSDIGLPQTHFLPALLAFNVGVEIGQLLFIGAVSLWMLATTRFEIFTRALPPWFDRVARTQVITSLLVALGVYWFLGRTFF